MAAWQYPQLTRRRQTVLEPPRELWAGGKAPRLASPGENARVRALYIEERDKMAAERADGWAPSEADRSHARGQLAREWVDLAKREPGVKMPAEERRSRSSARTPLQHQVDAAEKHIRWLDAGELLSNWQLTGIEATICARRGWPLPPAAYQAQESLL